MGEAGSAASAVVALPQHRLHLLQEVVQAELAATTQQLLGRLRGLLGVVDGRMRFVGIPFQPGSGGGAASG